VNTMVGVPDMPPVGDKYWESFTARVLDSVEEDAATRAPEVHRSRRTWNIPIPRMAPAFSIALVVVVAAGILMRIGNPVSVPERPVSVFEPVEDGAGRDMDETTGDAELTGVERKDINDVKEGEMPTGVAGSSQADVAEESSRRLEPAPEVAVTKTKGPPVAVAKKESRASPEVLAAADEALKKKVEPTVSETRKLATTKPTASDTASSARTLVPRPEPETRQAEPSPALDKADVEPAREEQASIKVPVNGDEVKADDRQVAVPSPTQQESPTIQEEAVGSVPSVSTTVVVTSMEANADISDEVSARAPAPAAAMSMEQEQPGEPGEEVASKAPVSQPEIPEETEAEPATSEFEASAEEPGPRSTAANTLYRGPQDLLTHARNLAEVRKFWESEQVLKDLLSQAPPSPIQEEASLLLVKVLNDQNRVAEAQRVLDDIKGQFPANGTIQTFELETGGKKPVQ